MSFNQTTLVGNLGEDPVVREVGDARVCNLSVATSESWKDKSGLQQKKTHWHRIVIWNPHLIGIAEKFLKKGSKVLIQGRLEYRKYEADGIERTVAEIVLSKFGGVIDLIEPRPSARDAERPVTGSPQDPQAPPEPDRAVWSEEDTIPF